MKKELLKIEQIHINRELYPRINVDNETSERYAQVMKTGVEFPPIIVAKLDKKYFLVDGQHRLDARKINEEEYIQTEVLEGLSEKEIFVESVKRNIGHGRPFSEEDIDEIKVTLENFKLGIEQISEIVRIPIEDLKPIVAEKIESHYDEDWNKGLEPEEAFKGEEDITSPESPISPTEHRKRKEGERLEKRYTIENFMGFLYQYSNRIEGFLKNLDNNELDNKDFKVEAKLLLEKMSNTKEYLKRVEKVLKEIVEKDKSDWKNLEKIKKETPKDRTERLLNEEQGHFEEDEENYLGE